MTLSDNHILSIVLDGGKLISARCTSKYLKKHGVYEYVLHRYEDNTLKETDGEYLRECIYRIVNHIDVPPVCKMCGKPIVFRNNGYATYCSKKCSNHDPDVQKRISDSCSVSLKKAYDTNGDSIKEKRRNTLSRHFGYEMNTSSPFELDEIRIKASERMKEKYGVNNAFLLDKSREERIRKQRMNSVGLQMKRGVDIEYLDNGNYLVRNCCPIHGDVEFTKSDFNNRFKVERYKVSNPCSICNPFNNHVSGMQMSLLDFIKSEYDGEIIENDRKTLGGLEIDIYLPSLKVGFEFNGDYWHMNPLKYKCGDVNVSSGMTAYEIWKKDRHKILAAHKEGISIYPVWEHFFVNQYEKQLDLIHGILNGAFHYIHPLVTLKNALDEICTEYELVDEMVFEYDKVRIVYLDGFHFNEMSIDNDFIDGMLSPDKRTIFVYDYEITDCRKFDVIKSDIRYALGKVENRIYARKCDLKVITNSESREFLYENSLFGYRSATTTIGLYHNGELVMVYSFGNNYYGRNGDTEVIRVCTKKNTQVIGGSSKCLKYYIDNIATTGERIVFYVDAIHHSGASMKDDFTFVKHSFGYMNYCINLDNFGNAFNRTPGRHREIKILKSEGHVISVPTNGVDVYEKIIQ